MTLLGLPATAGDRSEHYYGAAFKLDSSFRLEVRHQEAGNMTFDQGGWVGESWLYLPGDDDADFDLELYARPRLSIESSLRDRAGSLNREGRFRPAVDQAFEGFTRQGEGDLVVVEHGDR
jgi:hypothetical protein